MQSVWYVSVLQGSLLVIVIMIDGSEKRNCEGEPQKMNVKFHRNTSYTWNFQNFTCVITILVKFEIHFLGLPWEFFFGVTTDALLHLKLLKNVKKKKECNILLIILVQGLCPLKIKITQFPGGFRLHSPALTLKINVANRGFNQSRDPLFRLHHNVTITLFDTYLTFTSMRCMCWGNRSFLSYLVKIIIVIIVIIIIINY